MTLGLLLGDALRGLQRVAAPLFDLIAPERCGACGAEGSLLCIPCRNTLIDTHAVRLEAPPTGVCAAACVGSYRAGLGDALRTLKFHGVPRLAEPLGAALAAPIALVAAELRTQVNGRTRSGSPAVLVPIPTDPARRRERGFDHAQRLANAAARASGLIVLDLLERTRAVPPLHGLGRAERRRALDQAIAVRGAIAATIDSGVPIILVDDIWTSGATFDAAARALAASGRRAIGAVAVAREPLGDR